MKKLSSALAVALTLSAGVAQAGGIQLNLTNPGQVGGSDFFDQPSDFGNSGPFGSALVNNAFAGGGISGVDHHLIIQSIAGPLTSQGITGFLTYQMIMPAVVTADGADLIVANNTLGGDGNVAGSSFFMFFTPAAVVNLTNMTNGSAMGNKVVNNAGVLQADAGLLAGQVLLASGTVRINDPVLGQEFGIDQFGTDVGSLAANRTDVTTIRTNASTKFEINFTTLYGAGGCVGGPMCDTFVVNDLTGAALDLNTNNQGSTPSATGTWQHPTNGAITNNYAATAVAGLAPVYGAPTESGTELYNNFACGIFVGACDFQFQLGGSFEFLAPRVPEPASLSLVGLGLVGLGWAARRRRNPKV